MDTLIINEEEINIPTSWFDVTFDKFIKFNKIIKNLYKDSEEIDDIEKTLQNLKDNTKILSFWTGKTEEEISMWDLDDATRVMQSLNFTQDQYEPISISSFTIGDETFVLPEQFMAKSSFGRYIEAEQLEMHQAKIENGDLDYLPKQIAILAKKEGEEEKLNDDLIDERAEKFRQLDMATIWDVGFFLQKLEQKYTIHSLISQVVAETPKQ
jgi:exonuclease III